MRLLRAACASRFATMRLEDNAFVPVALETVGHWGKEARDFLRAVGKKIEVSTGEPRSTAFLFQRLSIAIQRGNAVAVLGSIPRQKDLHELFMLE